MHEVSPGRVVLTKLHPSLLNELAQWQARADASDVTSAPELEVVVASCPPTGAARNKTIDAVEFSMGVDWPAQISCA